MHGERTDGRADGRPQDISLSSRIVGGRVYNIFGGPPRPNFTPTLKLLASPLRQLNRIRTIGARRWWRVESTYCRHGDACGEFHLVKADRFRRFELQLAIRDAKGGSVRLSVRPSVTLVNHA